MKLPLRHFFLFLSLAVLCFAAHAEEAILPPPEPSLVDKLLTILGKKNIPRLDIPAPIPAAKLAIPANAPRNAGIEVARNFLPIYALDRDIDETPSVLPFFASAPLNRAYPDIVTLVLMVHDKDREAAKAFAFAHSAQDEAAGRHPEWSAADSFIFAPQFLDPADIEAHAEAWPDGGNALLRWSLDGWASGKESQSPDARDAQQEQWSVKRGISSFGVMDYILLTLVRPKFFPDLKHVVIAGTGTGADFVQRYAVLGISPGILMDEGMDVRFAAGNARSYLYLDKNRAVADAPGEAHDSSEAPIFAEPHAEKCPGFNAYPYGLDGMPPYGRRQGESDIRMRASARYVYVLAGAEANVKIEDTTPEGCATGLQGSSIKDRAALYFAAIERLYGSDAERTQRLYLLPKIGDDGLGLWRSICGMSVLFGDGGCKPNESAGNGAMKLMQWR